jgi:hypothetical protein
MKMNNEINKLDQEYQTTTRRIEDTRRMIDRRSRELAEEQQRKQRKQAK